MNIIQKYIIGLAKKWVHQDYQIRIQEVENWDEKDQQRLFEYLNSDSGKKLAKILVNTEATEIYAMLNGEVKNVDFLRGRASGMAGARLQISNLAKKNEEGKDQDIETLADVDDFIASRLMGYHGRNQQDNNSPDETI